MAVAPAVIWLSVLLVSLLCVCGFSALGSHWVVFVYLMNKCLSCIHNNFPCCYSAWVFHYCYFPYPDIFRFVTIWRLVRDIKLSFEWDINLIWQVFLYGFLKFVCFCSIDVCMPNWQTSTLPQINDVFSWAVTAFPIIYYLAFFILGSQRGPPLVNFWDCTLILPVWTLVLDNRVVLRNLLLVVNILVKLINKEERGGECYDSSLSPPLSLSPCVNQCVWSW